MPEQTLEQTLGWKEEIFNQPVNIRQTSEGLSIVSVGEIEPFMVMRKKRVPVDPQLMLRELNSSQGHIFANIGGSIIPTISIGGENYLLAVYQKSRDETHDDVVKLPSGYNPAEHHNAPREFMLNGELPEEVLVLPGDHEGEKLKVIPFIVDGNKVHPFQEYFFPVSDAINLRQPSKFSLQCRIKPINLEDLALNGSPVVYFHPNTNSAQYVWAYHLNTGDADLSRVSLCSIEDQFDVKGAPDKSKPVKSVFSQTKLIAIKLTADGKVTDIMGNIWDGKFIPINSQKVRLSEAFCIAEDGVAYENNTRLAEYLASH